MNVTEKQLAKLIRKLDVARSTVYVAAQVRAPAHDGHDSGVMADTVPAA